MLVYIEKQPPMLGNPDIEAEGPYSVVLAPTRELAQQVPGCVAARLCGIGSPPWQQLVLAGFGQLTPRSNLRHPLLMHPSTPTPMQIEEEARNLAHYTEFRVVSVVGGQSIEDQGVALRWVFSISVVEVLLSGGPQGV